MSILQSEIESAKDDDLTQETLEQLFGFAVIWGFGGAMINDKSNQNRTKFNDLFRSNFKQIAIPKEGTVYDYQYKISETHGRLWQDLVEEYTSQPIGSGLGEVEFDFIFVDTIDTVRLKKYNWASFPTKYSGNVGWIGWNRQNFCFD